MPVIKRQEKGVKLKKVRLDKSYEPKRTEQKWYEFWLEKGYFHADEDSSKPPYSIVIPPPNITGSLHMGHALNSTLQDILIRWKRMDGYNVLWVYGTDHAGIATQNVIEQQLEKEATDRQKYGRERFLQRAWQWKEEKGDAIMGQLMRLGASCDWERQRFTMDEGLSRAVRQVFVSLYKQGLIYRGDYIINWCVRCMTALSDLEVEYEDFPGHLYYIAYPEADGQGKIEIATTRPETMLGDVAVAVNPRDQRYANMRGKKVMLPILGRVLPIIVDGYVDMEFGTGALKITPAHDPDDFEIGLRHNLPHIKVIDENGHMGPEAGPYAELERYECRQKLLKDLKRLGYLTKTTGYLHQVGRCYRCKTVVEPLLSKQWFVRTKGLAKDAIAAVKDKKINIIPEWWESTYFDWMWNIRDWCISRQIWWGHQIPVWTCRSCSNLVVEMEEPRTCPQCGQKELEREQDVLDTWFSSALWPFSTLGWPEKTKELELFYPTSVLVTAFDILFFWVARMIMFGLKFVKDVPFREVYIHALVRDIEGQKMSKSKGNVIDPLLVADKFGADAFRFALAALTAQGRDIKVSEERIEGYRHFANKLWNAVRFLLMNLEDYSRPQVEPDASELDLAQRWILSRANKVVLQVRDALSNYKFNEAACLLYQFFWHEYCDWFVEISKLKLGSNGRGKSLAQWTLVSVLEKSLRLLHPFMPFITEELWQGLPHEGESITIAPYPRAESKWIDDKAEAEMEPIMAVVSSIRNVRSEVGLPPGKALDEVVLNVKTEEERKNFENYSSYIELLCKAKKVRIGIDSPKPEGSAAAVGKGVEIFVPLKGVIDPSSERQRLLKEIAKMESDLGLLRRKLSNEDYLAKAPREVVEKDRGKLEALREKEELLRKNLRTIEAIDRP